MINKTVTNFKQQFLLDPQVIFLNHGSFGATPKPVFEEYQRWQLELERQPVEFLGRRAGNLLAEARAILAHYLGTQPDNLVFVTNATVGLNIVAHSLQLGPGDEVLASDMEYGALDRTWKFLAQKLGFKYINHPTSLPILNEDSFVTEFWKGVNPHTRVIFLSHITSPTAMILPIEKICRLARQQGILTIIDGAHAPGQVEVNLTAIGADFYSGNCHKWLCAPKGSGFLYASPEVQSKVDPLVVSWGWESDNPGPSRFVDYIEWQGTRDLAAFLSVPAAIRFQEQHHWQDVQACCHTLTSQCLKRVSLLTNQPILYPDFDSMFAQMAVAALPPQADLANLRDILYPKFRIELPLILWRNLKLIRFSFQAYNDRKDIDALLIALTLLLGE